MNNALLCTTRIIRQLVGIQIRGKHACAHARRENLSSGLRCVLALGEEVEVHDRSITMFVFGPTLFVKFVSVCMFSRLPHDNFQSHSTIMLLMSQVRAPQYIALVPTEDRYFPFHFDFYAMREGWYTYNVNLV